MSKFIKQLPLTLDNDNKAIVIAVTESERGILIYPQNEKQSKIPLSEFDHFDFPAELVICMMQKEINDMIDILHEALISLRSEENG